MSYSWQQHHIRWCLLLITSSFIINGGCMICYLLDSIGVAVILFEVSFDYDFNELMKSARIGECFWFADNILLTISNSKSSAALFVFIDLWQRLWNVFDRNSNDKKFLKKFKVIVNKLQEFSVIFCGSFFFGYIYEWCFFVCHFFFFVRMFDACVWYSPGISSCFNCGP